MFDYETKRYLPLRQVYDKVYAQLWTDLPQVVRHRERVLGPDYTQSTPFEYSVMGIVMDLKIPFSEWERRYTLDDRARAIAYQIVKNMVEVVTRHYDEIRQNLEKMGKKG